MRLGFALWIAIACSYGCGKSSDKVTREQCAKVADHIADLIVDHYRAHPDELWDGMTAQPGETGLPPNITKDNFKAYLETPEGKTWMMQRHGQARSGTEQRHRAVRAESDANAGQMPARREDARRRRRRCDKPS